MEDEDKFAILAGSVIIGLGRIYDVLLLLLTEQNPEMGGNLLKRHTEGRLFFPTPTLLMEEAGPDE